ncbi:MAG: hypothetical protein LBI12_01280, partial [Treponema sp.]|nr:hypothetical protein [Treponema sp.]
MSVYVFTKKEVILKKIFPKDAKYLSLNNTSLSKHSPEEESLSYIDVSGLNGAELKKILGKLKKICNAVPWGIIDPKGSIKDPVALIIEGASDYLGPSILKNPSCINSKRFKKAADWRNTQ